MAHHPLTFEEKASIEALGGFQRVTRIVKATLSRYGLHRPIFTTSEVRIIERDRTTLRHLIFQFDEGKSVAENVKDLLAQANELQVVRGRRNYADAVLYHLVGAKLDIVLGEGKLNHHGFSVADHSTARRGDYHVEAAAIHVTTHPSEALVRKCAENLKEGLRPLIITLADAVEPAEFLLRGSDIAERVDVLDVVQFLTANVYERSLFKAAECRITLLSLLERYNAIVIKCETDPCLLIKLPK